MIPINHSMDLKLLPQYHHGRMPYQSPQARWFWFIQKIHAQSTRIGSSSSSSSLSPLVLSEYESSAILITIPIKPLCFVHWTMSSLCMPTSGLELCSPSCSGIELCSLSCWKSREGQTCIIGLPLMALLLPELYTGLRQRSAQGLSLWSLPSLFQLSPNRKLRV